MWPYLHPLDRSSANAFVVVYGEAAKKIQIAPLVTERVRTVGLITSIE
jgi:hypothetical protein